MEYIWIIHVVYTDIYSVVYIYILHIHTSYEADILYITPHVISFFYRALVYM